MYTQRVRRHPEKVELLEIKQNMEYLIKNKLSKTEMIDVAKRIHILECMLHYQKNYSIELAAGIKNDNYFIEIPYTILHRWNETESSMGWLYLATSGAKPNQVKVGASTIPLWKREEKYLYRWGYNIHIIWRRWTKQPFLAENRLKKCLKASLVSGLTSGDSNEWYHGNIDDISIQAVSVLADN